MKQLILTVFFAMLFFCLFAQDKPGSVDFSVGVNVLFPHKKLFETNNLGVGASAQAEYRLSHLIELTGSVGFTANSGEEFVYVNFNLYSSKNITIIQVPVLIGARAYVTKKLYLSGQLGESFFNENFGNAFILAPGVGARVSKKFDLTLSYLKGFQQGTSFGNLYFRAAYRF
jgi:hypothetical protein